jgi:chromosome segregation ATPase
MTRRRGRQNAPNSRGPHPDPLVERDLERVRQLQRRADVKAEQIADYRVEIDTLHETLRDHSDRLSGGRIGVHPDSIIAAIEADDARVVQLQSEIRALEHDIDQVHDEIASRMDKLTPSDLAFL